MATLQRRISSRHQGQFNPYWVPSLKLGKKEYRRPKDFKASVERSQRVGRPRRKAAIEQPEKEATKKRTLLEQSGDLDFESGASTSETTEEQLTDGLDTDTFCDGQGAKCETKEFAHSSTQTEPEVAPTAASEGTHLSVMHFHFICAGAKKIFTGLCYLYVFQAIIYTYYL